MKKSAFTIVELLIVIALISLLVVATYILINPITQINKSKDTRRKGDLAKIQRLFEDYNNDKNHYPPGNAVCADQPNNCQCHICSSTFTPYTSQLPCDPENPAKQYLYEYDCTNPTAPTWYRTFAKLSDPEATTRSVNICKYGCGPTAQDQSYTFAATSPNKQPVSSIELCSLHSPLYYFSPAQVGQGQISYVCSLCGSTYTECKNKQSPNLPDNRIFIDACVTACISDNNQ